MRVELKRGSVGNLLVVVRFEGSSNFDAKNLTWVPKMDEVDLIVDALKAVTTLNKRERRALEREERGLRGVT